MKKIFISILFLFGAVSLRAAATTDNVKYSASVAMTGCNLNSMLSSSFTVQSCTAIDNTANLYIDAYITIVSSMSNLALASDKAIYVYFYGSEDGTNYDLEESSSPAGGGSYILNSPTIFRGFLQIPVLNSGKKYVRTFEVASFFGGVLPPHWGIIIENFTGQPLASSGNSVSWTGITYSNQ